MVIKTKFENRKEMVHLIGNFLNKKPIYKGPPNFEYKVGDFTVEKDGTIVYESEEQGKKLKEHLKELGYVEDEVEIQFLKVDVPIDDMGMLGLKNLIFMIKSKEYLLNKVVGKEQFHVSENIIKEIQNTTLESKEDLIKLIQNKRPGDSSGFGFNKERISFIFPVSKDSNKNKSYVELAAMMVSNAKNSKRVSPKVKKPENEKYYFRVWLVRLGLGGKGSKNTRRALLKDLKGHTAFRTKVDEEKHKKRILERKYGDKDER
jgi:hypothetical protein